MGERGGGVGGAPANEIEGYGHAAARRGGINGDERKTKEGDGGVGLRDSMDVGIDGG